MSEAEKPGHSDDASSRAPSIEVERTTRTDSWRLRESEVPAERLSALGTLVGSIVADRYLVKRLLGQGGMGVVYEAEHVHMKKLVALKLLHGTMSGNPEIVARFEREAVAAGRLQHPGIVTATDFGRLTDGPFYLALELVEGESLASLLERQGALTAERALGIAAQVNSALIFAHAQGIVHRDLKPDNIMLVRTDDSEDFVKVLDFGIAKMRLEEDGQEGITRAGLIFGTPEYMSPEQAKGHDADERSDLYGVGMMLYEMLAGRSAFHSEDVTAMLTAQIVETPPPLPSSVPEGLRAIVSSLLEKDPADRPQSAGELAERFIDLADTFNWQMPAPRTSAGTRLDLTSSAMRSRPIIEVRNKSAPGPLRAFSIHPVGIGKKKVPLYVPLLALTVGTGIGAFAMLSNEEVVPPPTVAKKAQVVDAETQLLTEARSGDREALSALRKLAAQNQKELLSSGLVAEEGGEWVVKEGAGSATDSVQDPVVKQANRYLALGRGYSEIKHFEAGIAMYKNAVRLDPHLGEEAELLIDVRMALGARDAVEDGLDFAHKYLGSLGADLIYDVYLDHLGQPGMTPVVSRAMKLVTSGELLGQATPALLVALKLQNAKLCGDFRDLIPEAAKSADDRSVAKLKSLQARRGCGNFGNKDCFVCLRKEGIPLDEAVARAETHPSPTFLTPPEQAQEKN